MFSFLRNTSPQRPSLALQQALTKQGLPIGLLVNSLRVLTTRGRYAGRAVDFFRVFDPQSAAKGAVSVRSFNDLERHPELVMGAGHMEHDGVVSLTDGIALRSASAMPPRELADRAAHLDDEHLVFWNAQASHTSAAHLSEAATTWHNARMSQPAEPEVELPRLKSA
jgi:hypothetical protein